LLPDSFLLSRTIFIYLMIDEDEDDNSYVAMALHFGVRLTCQGHTPRIMVLTKSGNYVHPVVLVDIFHFSEICEQAPSLSHPEVDESRFYNLPIGSTAHPHWVGVGLSRKSRYASAGIRIQASAPSS
jgi:hypothetical protein